MIKGRLPMKYLLLFVFSLPLFSSSSFITPMEYASQLYKNPRGIGCHHCHGEKGEGKVVAQYIDKKKKQTFSAPSINEMRFEDFYHALEVRKNGMPRYFLTKKEVQSLYFYLQEIKGEE
jgi:hypothetical protein